MYQQRLFKLKKQFSNYFFKVKLPQNDCQILIAYVLTQVDYKLMIETYPLDARQNIKTSSLELASILLFEEQKPIKSTNKDNFEGKIEILISKIKSLNLEEEEMQNIDALKDLAAGAMSGQPFEQKLSQLFVPMNCEKIIGFIKQICSGSQLQRSSSSKNQNEKVEFQFKFKNIIDKIYGWLETDFNCIFSSCLKNLQKLKPFCQAILQNIDFTKSLRDLQSLIMKSSFMKINDIVNGKIQTIEQRRFNQLRNFINILNAIIYDIPQPHFPVDQKQMCLVSYQNQQYNVFKGTSIEAFKRKLRLQIKGYFKLFTINYKCIHKQTIEQLYSYLIEVVQLPVQFQDQIKYIFLPNSYKLKDCYIYLSQQLNINSDIMVVRVKSQSNLITTETNTEDIKKWNGIITVELYLIIIIQQMDKQPKQIQIISNKSIRQCKQQIFLKNITKIQVQKQQWYIEDHLIQDSDKLNMFEETGDVIKILLKQSYSLQYYGFNDSQIRRQKFKQFSFDNDQFFKQQIQKSNFPSRQFQNIFRNFILTYIFSGLKKHTLIKSIIKHIKNILLSSNKNNHRLWQIESSNVESRSKFNQTFIIYNILRTAEPSLKIDIMRSLMNNYCLPLAFYRDGILEVMYRQHYWISCKAFNIVSISLQDEVQGKTTLLNLLFNTDLPINQNLHSSCQGGINIAYNIMNNEEENINLIDVSSKVSEKIKIQLISSCNLLIVHSSSKYTERHLQLWLNEKKLEIPFILFTRDNKYKQSTSQFKRKSQINSIIEAESKIMTDNMCICLHIMKITPDFIDRYLNQFHKIAFEVYKFIKQIFTQQSQQSLWKFTDFLAGKEDRQYEILNQILKKIQNSNENLLPITDLHTDYHIKMSQNVQENSTLLIKFENQVKQTQIAVCLRELIQFLQNSKEKTEVIKKVRMFLNLIKKQFVQFFNKLQKCSIDEFQKVKQQKIKILQNILKNHSYLITQKIQKSFGNCLNQIKIAQNQEQIKVQLQKINIEFQCNISPRIFSIELFWRQIVYKCKQNPQYKWENDKKKIRLRTEIISLGRAIIYQQQNYQLINGDLLDMPVQFLLQIFKQNKSEYFQQKVMVIAVIGPQSSGKSTLLNFVFGCDFMSSVGRCTKGIYGTFFKLNTQIKNCSGIFILDTQGLMSTYSNKKINNRVNFDNKLLRFCLNICDIVIFNTKGDLTKECQPLIQMALDPELLQVNYIPYFYFVLNMNGNGVKIDSNQLKGIDQFCRPIVYNNQLAKNKLNKDRSISLSIAFQTTSADYSLFEIQNYFHKMPKNIPTFMYCKETKDFSNRILKILIERGKQRGENGRTLQKIISDMSQIWRTINLYPILTKYSNKKIRDLSAAISEWRQTKNQDLISYLKQREIQFKRINNQFSQQQLEFNRKKQIKQFRIKIDNIMNNFKLTFKDEKDIKEQTVKIFVEQKQKQSKLFLQTHQKTIEDYINILKIMLNIQDSSKKVSLQIYHSAIQMKRKIEQNNVSEEEKVNYFEKFWKNKQSQIKNFDRTENSAKLFQRFKNIYDVFLNKKHCVMQSYSTLDRQDSSKQIQIQIQQFKNKRIVRFKQNFPTRKDEINDIIFIQQNNLPPIFNIMGQTQKVSYNIKYLDMSKFYKSEQSKQYVKFVKTKSFLKYSQVFSYIYNKLLLSDDIIQFKQRLNIDVAQLGIIFKQNSFTNVIINKIIQKLWLFQKKDNNYNLKTKLLKEDIEKYQSIQNQIILKKQKIRGWYFKEVKSINSIKWIHQMLCISFPSYQQHWQNNDFKQKLNKFQTQKCYFKSRLLILNFVINQLKQILQNEKSNLLNKNTIFFIITQVINIVFLKLDKCSFYQKFNSIRRQINRQLINQLNSDLKRINLKIKNSDAFPMSIQFQIINRQNPIQFQDQKSFKKTISNFRQFWEHQFLLTSYQKTQFNKIGFRPCTFKVIKLKLLQQFKDNQILTSYKNIDADKFCTWIQKPTILGFLQGYINYDSIFQQLFIFIKQLTQYGNQENLTKIQKIISEVQSKIISINKCLEQIGQKLKYDFQIEVHSYALLLFWKFVEKNNWQKIQGKLLQFDKTKPVQYQKYRSLIEDAVGNINFIQAQSFCLKYKIYLQKIMQNQKQKKRKKLIKNYQRKMNKQNSCENIHKIIVQFFLQQIQKQHDKNEELKLKQGIKNYFIEQSIYVQKYYHTVIEKEYIQAFQKQKPQQSILQYFTEMQTCISEVLNLIKFDYKFIDFISRLPSQQQKAKWQKYFLQICLLKDKNQTKCILKIQLDFNKLQNLKWIFNSQFIKQKLADFKFDKLQTFLQKIVEIMKTTLKNQIDQLLKNCITKQDVKAFQYQIKTKLCKQVCPCCKKMCDVNLYNPIQHKIHKCNSGHNIRAIGAMFSNKIDEDNQNMLVPSFQRCELVPNNFMFTFDNKQISWLLFKKDKYSNWDFSMNQINNQQYWRNYQSKLWNYAGKNILKTFNKPATFVQFPTGINYYFNQIMRNTNYIFALDQSGSMQGKKWESLKAALKKNIQQISDKTVDENCKISIFKFNQKVTEIIWAKNPINNFTDTLVFGNGGTDFRPILKSISDRIKTEKNVNYNITMITDGLATYPLCEVELLKKIQNSQMNQGYLVNFQSIHIKAAGEKGDVLSKICKELKGLQINIQHESQLPKAFKQIQINYDKQNFKSFQCYLKKSFMI